MYGLGIKARSQVQIVIAVAQTELVWIYTD
jgi:hypothetical protein